MDVTYTATSLDDVAKLFDERAASARQIAEHARTQQHRTAQKAAADAWESGALILRSTTLTPATAN